MDLTIDDKQSGKSSSTKPAPATTDGKSATDPTCNCPLQPVSPCDAVKLEIQIAAKLDNMTESGTDAQGGTLQPGIKKTKLYKVQTEAPRSREAVPDVKDSKILALLSRNSFVIETIGQYPSRENAMASNPQKAPPDATVSIELARASFLGSQCPIERHPYLGVYVEPPQGLNKGEGKKAPGQKVVLLKGHRFYAPSLPWDEFPIGEGSFTILFDIIAALFTAAKPAEIYICASSCGIRETGKPNKDLSAVLRIYRPDTWCIGVKIPPLGTFKESREVGSTNFKHLWDDTPAHAPYKREQQVNFFNLARVNNSFEQKGSTTTSTSDVQVFDYRSREVKERTRDKDGRTTTTRQYSDEVGEDKKGKPIYGTKHTAYDRKKNGRKRTNRKNLKERLELESGFDLVILRNDREVTLDQLSKEYKTHKESLNTLSKGVKAVRRDGIALLKKSIEDLANLINDAKRFFNKLPQVGWKFDFEISVFAGSVLLEWGPNIVEAPLANERYYPVEFKFKGKISMEVFNLKLTVSFGVDAQAVGSRLVLKIEGTITLKATLEHEINMDLLTPVQQFEVKSEAGGKLAVVGLVTLVGATLASGELAVSGAFEFKGYLEVGWRDSSFRLEGALNRKQVLVTGYAQVIYLWETKIDPPIEVYPEGVVYTF